MRLQHRNRRLGLTKEFINEALDLGVLPGIAHQQAGQGAHFHLMPTPERSFDPRIPVALVHLLEVSGRALDIGAGGVVGFGHAVKGVQTGFAAGVGLVPGVGHAFLNFVRIAQVNGQHFVEVAVDDGPRGQQQAFFRVVIGRCRG